MGETKDHFKRLVRIAKHDGIGDAIAYDVNITLSRISSDPKAIREMADVEVPSLYLEPCLVRNPYYWIERFPTLRPQALDGEGYKDYCSRTGQMHVSEMRRFKNNQ